MANINQSTANVNVDDFKAEWKRLWRSRIDDKVLYECLADELFPVLSVERDKVIVVKKETTNPWT